MNGRSESMAVGWEQQSLPDAERDVGSSGSGVSSIQRKKDNQDQRLLEGWESVRRESKGITLTMIVRIGSLRSCRLSSETPIERSIAARGEMRWCACSKLHQLLFLAIHEIPFETVGISA